MIVYMNESKNYDKVYWHYRRECIDHYKKTGEKPYKLVLGEGWTPKELVVAILGGEGYVAERVELKC